MLILFLYDIYVFSNMQIDYVEFDKDNFIVYVENVLRNLNKIW